jgi:hypothetical protein
VSDFEEEVVHNSLNSHLREESIQQYLPSEKYIATKGFVSDLDIQIHLGNVGAPCSPAQDDFVPQEVKDLFNSSLMNFNPSLVEL